MKILSLLFAIVVMVSFTSCNKSIDVAAPKTSVSSANAFLNDNTAIAAVTSLYSKLSDHNRYIEPRLGSISYQCGLSADEFSIFSALHAGNLYYLNELNAGGSGSEIWTNVYTNYIYPCNAAIEGLTASTTLTATVKKQLLGEAKFMRAFNYFYLVNLYGDAPLALSTDYKINSRLARSSKIDVYRQIISDLKEAKELLLTSYPGANLVTASNERVRPISSAASALLSRVYLYNGEWAKAEEEATTVVSNTTLYDLIPLNQVFLKNSREAIFQIQPVSSFSNTGDGMIFNVPPTGFNSNNFLYLNQALASSFEAGDLRKVPGNWVNKYTTGGIDYYYPYKYKLWANDNSITTIANIKEYLMVLRLGEQYLIRSEARAMQDNLSGAIADIDAVRGRAGLPLLANTSPGISKQQLLDTILHERRVELFTEWGQRWLDIKRTNKVDEIMSVACPLKGGIWSSTDQYYPLPSQDIRYNSNLVQNEGY